MFHHSLSVSPSLPRFPRETHYKETRRNVRLTEIWFWFRVSISLVIEIDVIIFDFSTKSEDIWSLVIALYLFHFKVLGAPKGYRFNSDSI